MLIKSMARKAPSFDQLLQYFDKEQHHSDERFTHNCYAAASDRNGLVAELEHNATFLPKRRNGNFLYHEVVALEPDLPVSRSKQKRILVDLVRQYLCRRAPYQLAVFKIHNEENHLHAHICLSANDARGRSRCSLSKSAFAQIQRDLEIYKLATYPELGNREIYSQKARERAQLANHQTRTVREDAMVRRSGQKSHKEHHAATLKALFATVLSEHELNETLKDAGYELYKRGRTEGVLHLHSGRKFRLQTLKLEPAMEQTHSRISVYAERQAGVSQAHSHSPNQTHSRGRS